MHLIVDSLTGTGLRLSGVRNVHITTPEDVGQKLDEVSRESRIIAITNSLAKTARKEIEELRNEGKMIVEIPDNKGPGESSVDMIVRRVTGLKLR